MKTKTNKIEVQAGELLKLAGLGVNYDALVKVYNIADLACHEARGERDGARI